MSPASGPTHDRVRSVLITTLACAASAIPPLVLYVCCFVVYFRAFVPRATTAPPPGYVVLDTAILTFVGLSALAAMGHAPLQSVVSTNRRIGIGTATCLGILFGVVLTVVSVPFTALQQMVFLALVYPVLCGIHGLTYFLSYHFLSRRLLVDMRKQQLHGDSKFGKPVYVLGLAAFIAIGTFVAIGSSPPRQGDIISISGFLLKQTADGHSWELVRDFSWRHPHVSGIHLNLTGVPVRFQEDYLPVKCTCEVVDLGDDRSEIGLQILTLTHR